MTAPEQDEGWVWLARIRRPQGRKGEVFADILTDFPEKFAQRRRLWLLHEAVAVQPMRALQAAEKHTVLKGHDFSRAEIPAISKGALAPEGSLPAKPPVSPSPREVELAAYWLHKGGIVLHFAGIDSISAAETLSGLIVAIPRSERTPLGDGEVYIADLVGCTLFDVAPGNEPVAVGEIEDVDRTAGTVDLLVVRGATGEILIPFAKSYLRKIDLEARRVEMALPEGLIDLNAPGKA